MHTLPQVVHQPAMLPSLAARDAQTAHSQFPCVAPRLEHLYVTGRTIP